jgi:hypothetical protein
LLAAGRIFDAGLRAQCSVETSDSASGLARAIALTSQLRVRVAAGDLAGAEATLEAVALATRKARSPLRLLRARLIWAEGLRRGGRVRDAERQWRVLTRGGRAAPPLLRDAIARGRLATARASSQRVRPVCGW